MEYSKVEALSAEELYHPEAPVSHRVAVYRPYVWADGGRREPCLLGDFDGLGHSLQDLIMDSMPGFSSHSETRGIHCCGVDSRDNEVFLRLCHDETGVVSEIQYGSNLVPRPLTSTEHIQCGALFLFPGKGVAGWLAVHINNGRDVMPFLEAGLQGLVARTGRTLEFVHCVAGAVMERVAKEDGRDMLDLVKFTMPDDRAVAAGEELIYGGTIARTGGIRRVPWHFVNRGSFGDLVEIRNNAPGRRADKLEPGKVEYGSSMGQRWDSAYAFPENMEGLEFEDGRVTQASLTAALRRALFRAGAT